MTHREQLEKSIHDMGDTEKCLAIFDAAMAEKQKERDEQGRYACELFDEVKRLQKELAEQSRELERLKQRESDLLGDLKGSADAYDGLNNDCHDLLRVAVEFAQLVEAYTSYYTNRESHQKARLFLATPAAMALQQAKEET